MGLFLTGFLPHAAELSAPESRTVILAVGAAGEEEFGKQFAEWSGMWAKACEQAGVRPVVVGLQTETNVTDHAQLQQVLEKEPRDGAADLWLVLIGHGTFDGKEARFNLRGPDLTATELTEWLKPMRRPLVIINGAASSSPFLNKLTAPGRVVVTATKSGYEQNYTRFGGHLVAALTDPTVDLDKDGQVSLLEAFVMGSRRTGEWYETEGRLATEHALLDDNGDGAGTPADWFRGVRAVKKAEGGAQADGLRAHQMHLVRSERERLLSDTKRARRDELEAALSRLRDQKASLAEDEYLRRLEFVLLELAEIYRE